MQVSLNQIKTVTDLQRNYRQIVNSAKKSPVIITSNNKPEVAMVDVKYLEELEKAKLKWEMADTLEAVRIADEAERNGELIQADSVLDLLD